MRAGEIIAFLQQDLYYCSKYQLTTKIKKRQELSEYINQISKYHEVCIIDIINPRQEIFYYVSSNADFSGKVY